MRTLLCLTLLLPLYFRALAQPAPRSWGTRQKVEVGLHSVGESRPAPVAAVVA